jgi:c-di-GMP-binding flagellar brake protein YcgR
MRLPQGAWGNMTERRTARRYDLTLPVVIHVPIEREPVPRSGKTRDISTHGLYLLVDNELSQGAELDLTMTLPAEVTGGTEVFIRAIGKVVRVEKTPESSSDRGGVAAVIERFEIVRSDALAS